MKFVSLLFLLLCSVLLHAQDAKSLLRDVNKKFLAVNDYKAAVFMKFNIPGVKIKNMNGLVMYKRPNKFRVKANGIFFLPKQNPMQNMSQILMDTNAYTAVFSGNEVVQGMTCAVVNLVPLQSNNEIILGRFWIDRKSALVLKSQITTKNNGTIETENSFGALGKYALPDRMLITVEVAKIKVPKMLAADLNKKSTDKSTSTNAREKGTIELLLSDYKLNQKLSDAEFVETQ